MPHDPPLKVTEPERRFHVSFARIPPCLLRRVLELFSQGNAALKEITSHGSFRNFELVGNLAQRHATLVSRGDFSKQVANYMNWKFNEWGLAHIAQLRLRLTILVNIGTKNRQLRN